MVGNVEKYWSKKSLYNGLWARATISRDRFKALMALLQVVDPATEVQGDKLRKVESFVNYFKTRCKELYQPKQNKGVYNFKCDQCDAGYVGYTRGHLFIRVNGYRSKTSSVRKHYDNRHPGRIPDDLHSCFKVLKKCQSKFDCLVNEMLLIKQLRPCLNVQLDSIRAKVFV